jgi:hypothetical protein
MNEKKNFQKRFLEIVMASKKEGERNQGPEQLLRAVVREHAEAEDILFDEAAHYLSKRPDWEGEFGVNVYAKADGTLVEEFTAVDECTWIPLSVVVDAVDDGIWSWFDEEWIQHVQP